MLDLVDALCAVAETGTVSRAAVRLHLSQSAVSKRIDALEAQVGVPVLERVGRRVRLTPAGVRLVAELAPLLHQVRSVLRANAPGRPIVVGSSPALLSSWLPAALAVARNQLSGIELEIHSYRGPGVVERIQSGQLDIAIVVDAGLPPDLEVERVGREAMVVAGATEGPLPSRMWLIEPSSLTWKAIEPWLLRHKMAIEAIGRVESFSTLTQLAHAGFGPALVPAGIAAAMSVPFREIPGLYRPIAMVGRAGVLARSDVAALRTALRTAITAQLSR